MTRVMDLAKRRFGLLAILVLALALVVWFGWLGAGSESQPFTSPLPPTADPSYKISDDLLQLIALEEERPGEAQRQATREYAFDKEGRIRITIAFDGDKMPVSRSEPVEQQDPGRLVKAHGGAIFMASPSVHHVTAYVPLTRIKELASEEGVIKIFPDVWIDLTDLRGTRVAAVPTAAVAATVDVSQKIEPELLALVELEEQQPGQGRQQAAQDIFFDEQDRVRVIIELDPGVVAVQPSWSVGKPLGEQEAARLIIAYGAEIIRENELANHITAYVPLDRIKALAREEAVTHIWLDRIYR